MKRKNVKFGSQIIECKTPKDASPASAATPGQKEFPLRK